MWKSARHQIIALSVIEYAISGEDANLDSCRVQSPSNLGARMDAVDCFGLLVEDGQNLLALKKTNEDACLMDCKCLSDKLTM